MPGQASNLSDAFFHAIKRMFPARESELSGSAVTKAFVQIHGNGIAAVDIQANAAMPGRPGMLFRKSH